MLRCPASLQHPCFARAGGFRLGSGRRYHRLERQRRRRFADIPPEALASGTEFAKLIEPSRSIRTDALGQTAPARGGEGVAYRIEYGVRASTPRP